MNQNSMIESQIKDSFLDNLPKPSFPGVPQQGINLMTLSPNGNTGKFLFQLMLMYEQLLPCQLYVGKMALMFPKIEFPISISFNP